MTIKPVSSSAAPGWAEGKQICKRDPVRFRYQYVELQQIRIELLKEATDGNH
ncbi:hypothetical protein [Marinobacter antarcticus]|uniref:hypothetical protein n=1 Tax=Marinobacter antarcticus TaxID=564117 RepID=UPI0026EF4253|nr:hypothetical protein [Marinobacter antarcticus]